MTRAPFSASASLKRNSGRAAFKSMLAAMLIFLLATIAVACGSEEPAPTSTPALAAPTQAPTAAPTAAPAPTQAPATQAPASTAGPAPTTAPAPTQAQPTEAPAPTAAPEPTAAPTATAVPTESPTNTPAPTATPRPANTPTPEPAPAEDPIAADFAPLGNNLLSVATYDNATASWSVYDPSGTFSLDQLKGMPAPPPEDLSSVRELTSVESGKIYFVWVREGQTAVLGGKSRTLNAGFNLFGW